MVFTNSKVSNYLKGTVDVFSLGVFKLCQNKTNKTRIQHEVNFI